MFIKDKDFKKDEKIVKVRIKEGITMIDGKEVKDGYIELPENIALYKISHKPQYYLEIIQEQEQKIDVPVIKEIKKQKKEE